MDPVGTPAVVSAANGGTYWTAQRLLILLNLSIIDVLISVCYSIIAPFYPPLALKVGVSQFWIGFVFAIYQVAMFISTAFWGGKVERFRPTRILQCGIGITAVSLMAFAVLPLATTEWTFLLLSFALRIIEGLGAGMTLTGLLTVGTQEFSDRIGQITGWLEGFASTTGFLIGPVLGGLMNDAVGFWLPFVAFGCLLLVFAVISWFLLRNYQDIRPAKTNPSERTPLLGDQQETTSQSEIITVSSAQVSVQGMLKTPVVWVTGLCLVAATASFGLLEVGLALYAQELNNSTNNTLLSDTGKNALFFVCPCTYGVLVLILGRLIDKTRVYRVFFLIGLIVSTVGCLFVGPAPVLENIMPVFADVHVKLISLIVSLILIGIGYAFCISAFMPVMVVIALNKGYPECTATSGAASACIGVFYCLGMIFGPSVASPLCDVYGFASTGGLFACAFVCFFLVFAVFSFVYRDWFIDRNKRFDTNTVVNQHMINENAAITA